MSYWTSYQNNEHFAHHSQNVEKQEYNRKGLSAPLGSVWVLGGQNKLHSSLVPSSLESSWPHILDTAYLKTRGTLLNSP